MTDQHDFITTDELRAMFGEAMPMDAIRILFPEKHGLPEDTRPVSAVRADLVECALRYRGVPLPLSKDDQAERLAMLHVLYSCSMRRPIHRGFLNEMVDSLLKMPETLTAWDGMVDEALDIMRDARVRMAERLANPPKPRRRSHKAA